MIPGFAITKSALLLLIEKGEISAGVEPHQWMKNPNALWHGLLTCVIPEPVLQYQQDNPGEKRVNK